MTMDSKDEDGTQGLEQIFSEDSSSTSLGNSILGI